MPYVIIYVDLVVLVTYTIVPYHAPPRPVPLSFVYVTAHEKVPETKKGDNGVLLLRLGVLMTYTVPYRAPPINCALIFVAKSDNNRVA